MLFESAWGVDASASFRGPLAPAALIIIPLVLGRGDDARAPGRLSLGGGVLAPVPASIGKSIRRELAAIAVPKGVHVRSPEAVDGRSAIANLSCSLEVREARGNGWRQCLAYRGDWNR